MNDLKNTDEKNKSALPRKPTPSGKAGTGSCRRKMRTLRIAVICLTVILVSVICARIALPGMLVSAANRQFSKYLTSSVKLKAVHLGLLDGRATLQGLTVKQPDGFGSGLLLDLPEAKVKVSVWSLIHSHLIVDEVVLTDFIFHLVRDKDGKVNVACLIRAAEGKPAAAGVPKPIYIKKITVKHSTVQYTDFALGNEPLDVKVKQFEAVITDVYLYPARNHEPSLPGRAEATAQIVQPKFSDAPLGIIAQFGYFYSDQPIPELNGAVRLAGVELQSLHAVVKQDEAQAIGGDIMDFNGDISMAPEVFDCTVGIVTSSGNSLCLKIGGTPRRPLVDKTRFQGILADRIGEAGLNVLMNAPGTGEELGHTVLSSATVAGKGAGKVLMGIATSLYNASISVSKGNMSEAGENLMDTTSSTNAKEVYENTGASFSAGISKTGSAAVGIGGERARIWRADIQRRWTRNWEAACKSVQQKPFPSPILNNSADSRNR